MAVVWLGVALAFAVPARGQEAGLSLPPERPSGARLVFGPLFLKPVLDDAGAELFDTAGRFRGGPGATVGIGYDRGPVGVTVLMEMAGLEVGEPRERNGIGMGRASAVASSFAALVHWSPQRGIGRWQPLVTAGYTRQTVGKVQFAAGQLPSVLQHPTANGEPDAAEHAVSVSGGGARVGIGMERALGGGYGLAGRVGMLVEGSADLSILDTGTAAAITPPHASRARLQNTRFSFIPRLAVVLRWSRGPRLLAERAHSAALRCRGDRA